MRLLLENLDGPMVPLHHVNPHVVVNAARCQKHPTGAEGSTDHLSAARPHLLIITGWVGIKDSALLSFRHLIQLVPPKADGTIARGCGKIVGNSWDGARAKVESGDCAGVLRQDGHRSGRLETPHPDDLVGGAGCQQPVVLGHRHVRDLGRGSSEGEVEPAVAGAPHLDKQVVGSGEDIAAGFVKEKTKHWREVAEGPSLEAKVAIHSTGGIIL